MGNLIEKYKESSVQSRSALWFLVCSVLQRGISVIVTPIFTRLMTTEEYGQYTLFSSWLEILGIFLTLRLYFGVFMQGLVRYDHDQDEYTSALQGLTTTIELLGLAVYLPFRDYWNSLTGLSTVLMLCIFISSWASAMFGFWSTRQRVKYRYRALVVLTLSVAIAQPVSGIVAILAFQTEKVQARVVSMCVVQIIFFAWIFIYYLKKSGRFFHKGFWEHALKFNIPLVPHYLSHTLLNQSDRIMIGNMVGASAAGIYGLAYSLSWAMNIVNQALLKTLEPWIYQSIRNKNFKRLAEVSYIAVGAIGAVNLMLVALAPEVITFMAPEKYAEGVWLVPPLALTVVVMFMYNLFADFEFYYERTDYVATASVVGAAVNIGLNWFLLPVLGYQVAAYTTLIGYVVYIGMHYHYMRKVQKDEMNGERVYNPWILFGIVACIGACALMLTLLYPYPIIRYGICAFGALTCYYNRVKIKALIQSLRERM